MFEITVCVADFITLSAIFIVCFFFVCVCDCVNQQAPKGPNTFIGKKLLKSQFLKVQTLCLMVKSCQIPIFPWLPWGKRSHRCGNPMVYEAKDIYIYIP